MRPTTPSARFRTNLSIAMLIALVTGCGSYDRSGRYGDISITPVMVAPWWEFRDRLQPKFKLDADELLAKALPKTLATTDRTFRGSSVRTEVLLPNSNFDLSDIGGGEGVGSGDGADASDRKAADLALLETPLGSDHMMLYQLSNALYQEIAMLNSYIMHTTVPDGYAPYVIRLNIGAMIYADDLEADMYSTISFFTGKPSFGGDPTKSDEIPSAGVLVVPMLVTDAIEAAQRQQSRERLIDIATRVSGGIGTVGGDISFAERYNRLQQLIGSDMNSVFQVSRASDNTIRVKMGASNSVPAGNRINNLNQELVGRTLPVTLLVLVPTNYTKSFGTENRENSGDGPVLTAVQRTSFRHPGTGRLYPNKTKLDNKFKRVKESEMVNVYGLADDFTKLYDDFKKSDNRFNSILGKIALAVADNDYRQFVKILECSSTPGLHRVAPVVWTTFVDIFADTDTSVTIISLNDPLKPKLPLASEFEHRLAILDDGKKLIVQIGNGENLSASKIDPKLVVSAGSPDKGVVFAPTSVKVDDSGRTIQLAFPWFDQSLIEPDPKKAKSITYQVVLGLYGKHSENKQGILSVRSEEDSGGFEDHKTYVAQRVVLKKDAKAAKDPVAVTMTTSTAEISGKQGKIDITIKRDAKIDLPKDNAFITIEHASFMGISTDGTQTKIESSIEDGLVVLEAGKLKIDIAKFGKKVKEGKTYSFSVMVNQMAINKDVVLKLEIKSVKDVSSSVTVNRVEGP